MPVFGGIRIRLGIGGVGMGKGFETGLKWKRLQITHLLWIKNNEMCVTVFCLFSFFFFFF